MSGSIFFNIGAASIPFILGIAKSKRIKSGFSSSAFWIASYPSTASPQTAKPDSVKKKRTAVRRLLSHQRWEYFWARGTSSALGLGLAVPLFCATNVFALMAPCIYASSGDIARPHARSSSGRRASFRGSRAANCAVLRLPLNHGAAVFHELVEHP